MALVEQLKPVLEAMPARRKVLIAAVALAVAGGLIAFTRWQTERDFQVLFSGLGAEDAAQVVEKLKERATEYRISEDGSVIRVRSGRIAELRLEMAASGLPKTGRIGFELFDRTNLGATEFAEHINFQRALEGELERSVVTISEVESARVHLTPPKESVFLDHRRPAKASVLLRLKPGAQLSSQSVQAITHLLASAVEGLTPEMVSVLDSRGTLLNRPRREGVTTGDEPGEGVLEFRRAMERDLLAKIHATLEPLLGPDKFRAAVTVDCDLTSSEQSEETFDPGRSVMAVSQRTEDVAGASQSAGVPGTASNLPRPTSRPGQAGGGLTRRTENITYQTSRVVRRTRQPQGLVKRMSVSVLLDHEVRMEGSRRIVEAPPQERLKSTRDLISAVVGLQPERGDLLIVEAMPFEATRVFEPPPAVQAQPAGIPGVPAWLTWLLDEKQRLWLGTGLAASLLLATVTGILVRLLRRKQRRRKGTRERDALAAPAQAGLNPAAATNAQLDAKIGQQIALNAAMKEKQEQELLSTLKLPANATNKAEVLARRLSDEARRDPAAFAQVVRAWVTDTEA
jgi:flagellar M-ring protein FliF